MALSIPKAPSSGLFKEGFKQFQGLDEAVYRNIDAAYELARITRTSLGPNGMNKMVINHLEKLFVTNDAATIMKELDVNHPAAKLLVMASEKQESEIGDHTNFVVIFAGELLKKAEELLRVGLHPSEIIKGYQLALKKALENINGLCVREMKSLSKEELLVAVKSSISSKQYGYEKFLASLVVDAAALVMPSNPKNFIVDSIRVVKILGGGMYESRVVKGMVIGREPESTVRKASKAKVAVFTCGIDLAQTETKGTVLIKNAEQLLDFSKGEEKQIEKSIQEISDAGVKVVVSGSSIGELALHFLNRFGILVVKIPSKFELRRLCRVLGATPLARLGAPTAEEAGYCELVETVEIGSDRCTVFRQEHEATKTSTIVLRGSTMNSLDDVERALDDAINVVKALTKEPKLVAGAGAFEMELARRLMSFGEQSSGLNQYCIKKFAESLEVIPRTLAENSGLDGTDVISKLYAGHHNDKGKHLGVNVEGDAESPSVDAVAAGIFDPLTCKEWGIRNAVEAALTVLRVDQIIMAKPAGGPKVKENKNWDED